MPGKQGKVVFDNTTEPQLVEILREVGRVVSFKLLFDKDTGKPRGYGFCTFEDAETASSAVRNLNNYFIGGRQLRVDFSESDKDETASRSGNNTSGAQEKKPQITENAEVAEKNILLALRNCNLSNSLSLINDVVARYPPDQILQAISQLKLCLRMNPEALRIFLSENPHFVYAISHAFLITNLIGKRFPQPPGLADQFNADFSNGRESNFVGRNLYQQRGYMDMPQINPVAEIPPNQHMGPMKIPMFPGFMPQMHDVQVKNIQNMQPSSTEDLR